ncbi:uncharacterized protein [Drosophila virilis]|uniref:Uncharacterized protein n=1 Tax=Drosophila virilis TaxID=7244 RepID=B4MC26_DROVI|nr:uncharacterized protein LOC6634919 [Drosophila virilis]EDW58647.1 uncharacterized protein Dvir_GJ14555 [Drosophila virilis]
MENASTVNKRRSLTLSSRLLQKRHSASPQSRVRASASQEAANDGDSPGSSTVNIGDNVESTPPSKKNHTLDDSLDFSPRNSLSPSCLFSQTLVSGSPEVSWRWNCDKNGRGDKVNTTSDSGFDSEEFGPNACKQKDRRKQVRDAANEHRRKQFESRQWRAQQIRDHELLKERCDKLHRQLLYQQTAAPAATADAEIAAAAAEDPALADFLNDSDTDCFLIEASQQLESKLAPPQTPNKTPAATTPTSHHKSHKEKQSSFYMKFLEDESETEDWFLALDEAMLEATNPKKPRLALQRYKSMPSKTAGDASAGCSASTAKRCTNSASSCSSVNAGLPVSDTPRIKRHASTHALSPATSSARGNLFGRRP